MKWTNDVRRVAARVVSWRAEFPPQSPGLYSPRDSMRQLYMKYVPDKSAGFIRTPRCLENRSINVPHAESPEGGGGGNTPVFSDLSPGRLTACYPSSSPLRPIMALQHRSTINKAKVWTGQSEISRRLYKVFLKYMDKPRTRVPHERIRQKHIHTTCRLKCIPRAARPFEVEAITPGNCTCYKSGLLVYNPSEPGFDFRRGHSRMFAWGNHAGQRHWPAFFLVSLAFINSVAAPYSPHLASPSSALKTSLLRDAQIISIILSYTVIQTASSGTIATFENGDAARLRIEPGSPWWEASSLTALPPRHLPPSECKGGGKRKRETFEITNRPPADSSTTGILSAVPRFTAPAGTDQRPGFPRIRPLDQTLSGRTELTSLSADPSWHPTVEWPRPRTRMPPPPPYLLLASQLCEPIHSGFSRVGIVPDEAADRLVFTGISRFPRPFIPALLHTHFASPSSALKTSMLRASQISSHASCSDARHTWRNRTDEFANNAKKITAQVDWKISAEERRELKKVPRSENYHEDGIDGNEHEDSDSAVDSGRDFLDAMTHVSNTFAATIDMKSEEAENTGYLSAEDPNELDGRLKMTVEEKYLESCTANITGVKFKCQVKGQVTWIQDCERVTSQHGGGPTPTLLSRIPLRSNQPNHCTWDSFYTPLKAPVDTTKHVFLDLLKKRARSAENPMPLRQPRINILHRPQRIHSPIGCVMPGQRTLCTIGSCILRKVSYWLGCLLASIPPGADWRTITPGVEGLQRLCPVVFAQMSAALDTVTRIMCTSPERVNVCSVHTAPVQLDMGQSWNEGVGKMGDPRENRPTSGIVRLRFLQAKTRQQPHQESNHVRVGDQTRYRLFAVNVLTSTLHVTASLWERVRYELRGAAVV
ncbi:hypothetical protein PR048_032082 [Dryococelus australis]|uniref:Uncharacterized protein n=1 Tax=Dryococelus australis TaxID=614101 RepID=A0ABQ9G189_9NEOP|nr:hypothetical protein PR048_032082 [Dryococelus australis]